MAKRRKSRTSGIEKTLRNAQSVLAGYVEAGGNQVRETISSLDDAISALSKRASATARGVVGSSKRRTKRKKTTARRTKKSTARKKTAKRAATTRRAKTVRSGVKTGASRGRKRKSGRRSATR